jgi:large subunit ribosomal protein L15
MKLHDLRPAEGAHKARTRVGRGIAAGKGKTAGRGTKGQKARAGGSIPPWFEGGQTPLHMRIPKLRGFRNRGRVEFEVVNVGAIQDAIGRGRLDAGSGTKRGKGGPATVNQDILRGAGLVRTLDKPLKILGGGELSTALFVVADAFTGAARAKIEAAGGSVNVLEVPTTAMPALGTPSSDAAARPKPAAAPDAEPEPAAPKRRGRASAAAAGTAETGPTDEADGSDTAASPEASASADAAMGEDEATVDPAAVEDPTDANLAQDDSGAGALSPVDPTPPDPDAPGV